MAVPTTMNVYNIVLAAPFITVLPYDTADITFANGAKLATAQVQQTYNGANVNPLDIIGYRKQEPEYSFRINNYTYGMIDISQIAFWWKATQVPYVPPS